MSSRAMMKHRCVIERDVNSTLEDEWGDSEISSWQVLAHGIACHFWYEQSEPVMDGDRQIEIENFNLIVPLRTDITADDRIAAITDRRGNVLQPGPLRVNSLGRRRDHLQLKLVRVS